MRGFVWRSADAVNTRSDFLGGPAPQSFSVAVAAAQRDAARGTALHRAAFHNYCSIIKFLLERGAEVNVKDTYKGPVLSWTRRNLRSDKKTALGLFEVSQLWIMRSTTSNQKRRSC